MRREQSAQFPFAFVFVARIETPRDNGFADVHGFFLCCARWPLFDARSSALFSDLVGTITGAFLIAAVVFSHVLREPKPVEVLVTQCLFRRAWRVFGRNKRRADDPADRLPGLRMGCQRRVRHLLDHLEPFPLLSRLPESLRTRT